MFNKIKSLLTPHFVLTLCFSAFAFLMILGLFFIEIPKDNLQQIHLLAGIVVGWVHNPINYYFGKTNKEKTNEETNQRAD